jgi:ribonuclease Z
MAGLVFLGTAAAVAFEGHDNTHLLIESGERTVLVDCVGNPVLKLGKIGREVNQITDLIVTHFHPDHVTGIPLLLMNMWLLGRERRLAVYGLEHALSRLQAMLDLFDWSDWGGMYPIDFQILAEQELIPVLDGEDLRILSSPVDHLMPTIGLRITYPRQDQVIAYSSDSAPCPQIIRLADGADILIHEAAGDYRGHTSPADAGKAAEQAGVKKLYLIHYSVHQSSPAEQLSAARKTFSGPVELAEDLLEIQV